MNELFNSYQLQVLKPILTALLLPPVPLMLLIILAARMLARRQRLAWLLLALSILSLWMSTTNGAALIFARSFGLQPAPLSDHRIESIAANIGETPGKPRWAIVVLGGGREADAPEYGTSSLTNESLQRLRFGLWLSRRTSAPVAFSGGQGWAQSAGDTEAAIAARIAAQEFALPLRWVETGSRDTRQNAEKTIDLLRAQGIEHVLLVTHGWHMRRALRAFRASAGGLISVEAAPMGLSTADDIGILQWLPSATGTSRFRSLSREAVGLIFGA